MYSQLSQDKKSQTVNIHAGYLIQSTVGLSHSSFGTFIRISLDNSNKYHTRI